MFWKKADNNAELQEWNRRLDAGEQEEATLATAARLQNAQPEPGKAPLHFRRLLRNRLLEQHRQQFQSGHIDSASRQNVFPRRFVGPLTWRLAPIALLVVLVYVGYKTNWLKLNRTQMAANIQLAPQPTSPIAAPFGMESLQGAATLLPSSGKSFQVVTGAITSSLLAIEAPAAAAPIPAAPPAVVMASAEPVVNSLYTMKIDSNVQQIEGSQIVAGSAPESHFSRSSITEWSLRENDHLGFAVGGAKDIGNFRENIRQNYLPLPTDVTYEGLFYDYYFATGQNQPCEQLFCPSYAQALSRDPISGKPEYFMAVGLNSGIRASDFARKKLNLVIVLDISDSMNSPFDRYYYDQFGQPHERKLDEDLNKPKLLVAKEAVIALLNHLRPEDRLGIVLFSDSAYVQQPLTPVSENNLATIKGQILSLQAQGGTNMEAGYQLGTDLLAAQAGVDGANYENRIIFLTDAQPNTGDVTQAGLLGLTNSNTDWRIYTTFIGVGVDFNSELIEPLTKIEGANYYSVHSSAEFLQRMDEGFDFMVTPLLFDLTLTFDSPDFAIAQVYGSPEADRATGQLMRVNTLFPSASKGGAVKGGLILLQLQPKGNPAASDRRVLLTVGYRDRNGEQQSNRAEVELVPPTSGDFYDNLGIRKGILLARYANLLRDWLHDQRQHLVNNSPLEAATVNREQGIRLLDAAILSQWERQSLPLQVAPVYGSLFRQFRNYFAAEMAGLQDDTLQQELEVLDQLIRLSE